ncbi:cation:proton antiporter [Massilia sp. DD77]
MALAGIAVGVLLTLVVASAQRLAAKRFGEDAGAAILLNLLLPFGAWLAAEHLRASGILAAVAAGTTMSYVELRGRALATTRMRRAVVWDTVQFALNGVMSCCWASSCRTSSRPPCKDRTWRCRAACGGWPAMRS